MKVTVNIDCTPEEARSFIGLPHIAPLQDRMMKALEEKMQDNIRNLDPETFIKVWMPATVQGWGEMQKMFWNQMGQMGANPGEYTAEDKPAPRAEKAKK